MSTTLQPPVTESPETASITVPDHPGALLEQETAAPREAPAPGPPESVPNPMPWVIAAVAVVAWLIGFALGILAVGVAPVQRALVEGWAPAEYGLAMEHLARAPITAGAEYGLAMEHLTQAPAAVAAYSLAREHLAGAPTGAAYGLAHEHLAQAPVSPAAVSLAQEHLAQAP